MPNENDDVYQAFRFLHRRYHFVHRENDGYVNDGRHGHADGRGGVTQPLHDDDRAIHHHYGNDQTQRQYGQLSRSQT